MLNHYAGTDPNGTTRKEKFNYILDQYDDTAPGLSSFSLTFLIFVLLSFFSKGYITREHGQQILNRLNNYQKYLI